MEGFPRGQMEASTTCINHTMEDSIVVEITVERNNGPYACRNNVPSVLLSGMSVVNTSARSIEVRCAPSNRRVPILWEGRGVYGRQSENNRWHHDSSAAPSSSLFAIGVQHGCYKTCIIGWKHTVRRSGGRIKNSS